MKTENNKEDVWNVERILKNFLYYSDEYGFLPKVRDLLKAKRICKQRFYAVLRAYSVDPEWFFESDYNKPGGNFDEFHNLIGKSHSREKIIKFRELIRSQLTSDTSKQIIDEWDFFSFPADAEIYFSKLMKIRKRLYTIEKMCPETIGNDRRSPIDEVIKNIYDEQLAPICQLLDKMLILLMGDLYDRTFTAEQLYDCGYPAVTEEEMKKIEEEDKYPF